jgi:hypothetical protein
MASFKFVMSVSPPARMEQLGFHWKDFSEIWYLSIIRGSVEKIHVSFNMSTITGTLHEDLYVCDNTLLNYS